jgi:hypothetical protein
MIADVSHRTMEEQIRWYIEVAVDAEWEDSGEEILAKLRHREQEMKAYWRRRPDEGKAFLSKNEGVSTEDHPHA